jgi:alpha-glucosidase
MEFVFPHQGFAKVVDQFMLGDSILVCPMLVDGTSVRKVDLPNGKWTDDQGNDHEGGQTITVEVPLNRLPYFILNEKLSSE